ncbi:LacI family transcriptional regulator [Microbacterium sp. SLBN-154]|uniref:LacI family DNA-binding transcriptional regulator n=1 Tax=Microbacterium sp. SLBN-154 TaxID=2768458 RepID=UPI00115136A8|nr:LacI family DNA-binding transcriptional regulator [Microbacterium sp. SLBN-154]TQK20636.1 LacI family transcriptional regulator [Microbacterium sp. SLBN-154]
MTAPDDRRARLGMREVAAAAGVSPQTVSRVLNDHPHIRPETRARVLETVSRLGYRVNNAARTLGTRSTRTLGVLASDATLYGPAVGIAALDAAAREQGRWIATAYADADSESSVIAAADRLLTQGVDGIIVLAPHLTTSAALRKAHPDVRMAALHEGEGAERQAEGAAAAVRHLIGLGHRRIARLAGPAAWSEAVSREAGAVAALTEAGLDTTLRWEGDWTAATAAGLSRAIAAAAREPDGPTAVVAANDQMALGLISGLRAAGVEVPGSVSVTGFDDNPDAAFYRPALTTVRLDVAGEARRAVAEVLGEIDAPPHPAAPTLVPRASTTRPPTPTP